MPGRHIATNLGIVVILSGCARANSTPTRSVIVHSGSAIVIAETCPAQRPPSWPKSQFRVVTGDFDPTLEGQSGALVFDLRADSIPDPQAAQVSLWSQTFRRDSAFAQSPIKIVAPVGRYVFRVRKIAAQAMQDSIDVRGRYVDTVKVVLGREVVCLN
jgi:hypothetical protein